MLLILVLFAVVCIAAIVAGRAAPSVRWVGVAGAVAAIYLVSLIAWWIALYFQIVPLDRTLAALKVYRTEGLLGGLIFFGPPAIPAAASLAIAVTRRRRGRS